MSQDTRNRNLTGSVNYRSAKMNRPPQNKSVLLFRRYLRVWEHPLSILFVSLIPATILVVAFDLFGSGDGGKNQKLQMAASAITVVALVFALYQARSSQVLRREVKIITESTTRFRELSNLIEEITESVSTHYVDVFPQNIDAIVELMDNTKERLLIMTDIAGYGHFSSPSLWRKYNAKIKDLLEKKIELDITIYSQSKATQSLRNQFGPDTQFEEIAKSSSFATYFKHFPGLTQPKTTEEFLQMRVKAQEDVFDRLQALGAPLSRTESFVPVFMWIRDGREAIFSFHTQGIGAREVSFRTQDKRLIDTLNLIADSVKKPA